MHKKKGFILLLLLILNVFLLIAMGIPSEQEISNDFNYNDTKEGIERVMNEPKSSIIPTYQSRTVSATGDPASSRYFSHNTPTGEERLLVVLVGIRGDNTVSSCTYNGMGLTFAIRAASGTSSGQCMELWYMVNPPTGSYYVSVSYQSSNPTASYGAAMSYNGVSQGGPIGATAGDYSSSGSDHSVYITTTSYDSIIVGGLNIHGEDSLSLSENSGVRQRYEDKTGSNDDDDICYWGGDRDAASTQQYDFGAQGSVSDEPWAIVCAEFKYKDESPPTSSNLIESEDPLELGDTEVISVDVNDPSGVNQVKIEFEGSNHSMVNIGGDTWQYDSWTPSSTGNYPYTIWMEDNWNNWGSTSGSIQVLIFPPTININQPSTDDVFRNAPDYSISLSGNNLDDLWYNLNDGSNITIDSSASEQTYSNTISSAQWNPLLDGYVTINFYADNTYGYESKESVTIIKDTTAPVVTINSPEEDQIFKDRPAFSITIDETNTYIMRYNVNGGDNFTITQTDGYINSNEWNIQSDGNVILTFYAIDAVGHQGSDQVTVVKDSTGPTINIITPGSGTSYEFPPEYNLDITDVYSSISNRYYTLNGGSQISCGTSGRIDENAWNALSPGSVTITFYAVDSAGNVNSDFVMINKNSTININQPNIDDVFRNAPDYSVSLSGINLNEFWYNLNDGSNITIDSSASEQTYINTISSAQWNPLLDGYVTINFYATNTLGDQSKESVTVIKDTTAPVVTINSPDEDQVFKDGPAFSITYDETNIYIMRYNVNGGDNFTFTGNDTIDSDEWNSQSEGFVILTFYVIDAVGNQGSDQVTVIKDSTGPVINIIIPGSGTSHEFSPEYNLDITDVYSSISNIYYTLNGGSQISCGTSGRIDENAWNALPLGSVNLTFYAIDSAGNINSDFVMINKNSTININQPFTDDVFRNAPDYSVSLSGINLNEFWYNLNDGSNITIDSSATEQTYVNTISSAEWNSLPDGYVTINFYANNTLGVQSKASITVIKDTTDPSITIIDPKENNIYSSAPSFEINPQDANLDEVWYTVDSSPTQYNITGSTIGTIDLNAWDLPDQGWVTITFYADDKVGNQKSESVNVIKDNTDPEINIITPESGSSYDDPPTYELSITDTHSSIDEIYFTLNGQGHHKCGYSGTIEKKDWNTMNVGPINLTFYAVDAAGNKNSDSVMINKTLKDFSINTDETSEILGLVGPIILFLIIGTVSLAVVVGVVSVIKRKKLKVNYLPKKKNIGGYKYPSTTSAFSSEGFQRQGSFISPDRSQMEQYRPSQYPSSRELYAHQAPQPRMAPPQVPPSYRAASPQAPPPYRATSPQVPSSYRATPPQVPSSYRATPPQVPSSYRATPPQVPSSYRATPPQDPQKGYEDPIGREQIPQLQQIIFNIKQELNQLEVDYGLERLDSSEYWEKRKYLDEKLNALEQKIYFLRNNY